MNMHAAASASLYLQQQVQEDRQETAATVEIGSTTGADHPQVLLHEILHVCLTDADQSQSRGYETAFIFQPAANLTPTLRPCYATLLPSVKVDIFLTWNRNNITLILVMWDLLACLACFSNSVVC